MHATFLPSAPQGGQPDWVRAGINRLMMPVLSRAGESQRWFSRWRDPYAERIAKRYCHGLGSTSQVPRWPGRRARWLDEQSREPMLASADAVIEIGCGLSTRFQRLGAAGQPWFCLDSALIYRCWACFFAESEQLRYIPAQDPCDHWLAYLAQRCRRPLIVLENRGCPLGTNCRARWQKPMQRYFPQAHWLAAEATVSESEGQRQARGIGRIVRRTTHPRQPVIDPQN